LALLVDVRWADEVVGELALQGFAVSVEDL
jgi:hypothetical protein